MKRALLLCMVVCLFVATCSQEVVFAASSSIFERETSRDAEIEEIFQEINKIIAEKNHLEYLETVGTESAMAGTATYSVRSGLERYENELNNRLEELDVVKVDFDDEEDMKMLTEVLQTTGELGEVSLCADEYDTAPDLAALADAYTVYIQDGKYRYKGEDYLYRIIHVLDNKGNHGLTINKEFDAVPKNVANSIMGAILEYNFGFGISYLIGKLNLKYGTLLDWTLGTIFSVIEGVEDASGVMANGSESLYRIFMTSVTKMTYYYCYDTPQWKFIGTSAYASFSQTHLFAGNVNGHSKHESVTNDFSSTSGWTFNKYIEKYADAKAVNAEFCYIAELGKLEVYGYKKTFEFIPKFYDLPGFMVH